jgi:hypothetical protein
MVTAPRPLEELLEELLEDELLVRPEDDELLEEELLELDEEELLDELDELDEPVLSPVHADNAAASSTEDITPRQLTGFKA